MVNIKGVLLQWFLSFLIKKSGLVANKSASGGDIKNENISNQDLAEELHKLIIRKCNERKTHATFIDNTSSADLTDMQ